MRRKERGSGERLRTKGGMEKWVGNLTGTMSTKKKKKKGNSRETLDGELQSNTPLLKS